jgi:hypothetical protein
MKMRTGHFTIAALAAILTSCAAGQNVEPASSAALTIPPDASARPGIAGSSTAPGLPGRLTQSEVVALLSNNTVSGVDANGRPYQAFLSADGEFRMRRGNVVEAGAWRAMPDGAICSTRTSAPAEQCYLLWREGNLIRFDRPNGTPVGSVTVLPGNPENL